MSETTAVYRATGDSKSMQPHETTTTVTKTTSSSSSDKDDPIRIATAICALLIVVIMVIVLVKMVSSASPASHHPSAKDGNNVALAPLPGGAIAPPADNTNAIAAAEAAAMPTQEAGTYIVELVSDQVDQSTSGAYKTEDGRRDFVLSQVMALGITGPLLHVYTRLYLGFVAKMDEATAVGVLNRSDIVANIYTNFPVFLNVRPSAIPAATVLDIPAGEPITEGTPMPTATWDLSRIGISGTTAELAMPPDAKEVPVHVFVLGSGMDPAIDVASAWSAIDWNPTDNIDANGVRDDGDADSAVDENGSGTAIAKVVSAVCPDATLHNIRILDRNGVGTAASCLAGLDRVCVELVAMKQQTTAPFRAVVNLSCGSPILAGAESTLLDRAVDEFTAAMNVPVVCCAGDMATTVSASSPARCVSCLAVAAYDLSGEKCAASNFGPRVMYAPGAVGTAIQSYSTSIAAAHATGVVARAVSVRSVETVASLFAFLATFSASPSMATVNPAVMYVPPGTSSLSIFSPY